jgi:tetratricopeptide (TPR) repeat protein
MRVAVLLLLVSSSLCAQNLEKAKKLYDEKKYAEAKNLLTPVGDDHKDYAAAQYYLGRIAFDEQKLDEAEEYFEEAVDANDKIADYHYWYGSTMGSIAQNSNTLKQGFYAPKIKSEFEKTVELDPNNLDAHWGLIEFYSQAPGFMGGSWEKAEATARAITKINKNEGYRALATVYERQEKWNEAEKQYIEAYKADPTMVYNLSNFYLRQKKYDKSFALFDDLLKKEPTNMLYVYSFGRISAMSGQRLDQGEAHLLSYLAYQPKEKEPSHAGANMRLAQIKEKQGKKAEAKKLFEAAIKADPNLKEAKEGLERVK